ncbi:MAG TPA: TonB-dependent receptor [Sphingomicrobium sp.]|nr:TonB-dependent receptor [Sphingomicrobium sp.]
MKLSVRHRLLATTLFVGAGVIATPALAQSSPPDNSGTPTIPETTTPPEGQTEIPSTSATGENVTSAQDIVVTGSRIPQPNLEQASPVTVITAQEVKLQGTTRTEDLINSLPQSFAAQGSNISNGATGTATVNLRGLGESRTLVLINGKRLMPGDPRSPVADINFVPAPLIKRVDVLTGGASSVYGADAVAGVVNFIMDTNFRGLRVDAQASVFMHDNNTNDDILAANRAPNRLFNPPTGTSVNGGAQDIAVVFGAGFNDNRGSLTAYATYRKQDAVLQETRDYSFCALSAASPAQITANNRRFNCGGSATSANGTFFTNVGTFQVGPGGTFIPGSTPFNFNPFNYFQRPNERYTLGAFAEYDLTDAAKPYLEAMFMDDQSVAQIAPSGVFFNVTSLNCDNPLLSAQQRGTICVPENTFVGPNGETRAVAYVGRRNVEGGGRRDDLQHTAFRVIGGVRGDVARGLSYDTFFQFGRTNLAETYLNDFSIARSERALDVVTNPATGQPVCRSVLLGIDRNCVPYNIFREGGVTPQALEYLQTPGFQRGNTEETVANANITVLGGEYGLQLPWATRGPALNVGAEYRKESLRLDVDEAFRTGDLAGQGGPTLPVQGSFDVRELFTEVDIPIVHESFIHELSLNAGYRYSDYKVADNRFSTNTYKVAGELAPVRDLRVRGSYNRAVRAPNVVELFSAQSVGLGGSSDPCAGRAVNGRVNGLTFEQCARTGVTAAQFGNIIENPAEQYNSLFGGNPNLEPETADSYTAGIVLQPRFLPGLAITADYFDIKVRNLIGVIGYDTTIAQCIATGDPFFCSLINRAPGSGSLFLSPSGFITDINTNVGGLRTKGVDINGSYSRRLGGMGTLNLSMVGTYLRELSTNPVADVNYDCRGFYGAQCGTPNPKWRHKARAGFTLPNGLGLSGQWRYFSRVRSAGLSEEEELRVAPTSPIIFPGNQQLNAVSYFDLAFSARITDKFNFRIGANNILDREPPIAGSQVVGAGSGNGNTYPQVYDALGRFLFANVTVDF